MKNLVVILLLLSIFICVTGCGRFFRYETAFRGKVIDAETGEPIEGAVALGVWNGIRPGNTYYYDAREAVTDKNGEFLIPGIGFCFMIDPVHIQVFKAGHKYHAFWRNAYKYPNHKYQKDWLSWEDRKPIVKLKKLSMKERNKQGGPDSPPTEAPYENVKRYLKEMYIEDKERGLNPPTPKTHWGVEKDE